MADYRVSVLRYDVDGSIHEGTAIVTERDVHDFRDMDDEPMPLPAGSRFQIVVSFDRWPRDN